MEKDGGGAGGAADPDMMNMFSQLQGAAGMGGGKKKFKKF